MSHNTASCATRGFAFRRTTSEVRLNIPCFGVDPVTVCSLHRTKYRDAYSRDFLGRRWTQPPSLIGKQALEKSGNCMPEKNGSQTAVRRGFEPEVERPRSHLRSAALIGCSPGDLAAVCILTKSFRLQGRKLNQKMHQYTASCERRYFFGSDDKFKCAVWYARLSLNSALLRSTQLYEHARVNPASGFLGAGLEPDMRQV